MKKDFLFNTLKALKFVLLNFGGIFGIYENNFKMNYGYNFSELSFDKCVINNEAVVKSPIQCAFMCTRNCASFSYHLDAGSCRIFAAKFCSSINVTTGPENQIQYYHREGNNTFSADVTYNKPKDCQEVQTMCKECSGVYSIYPDGVAEGIEIYCDMSIDGGGWTVFQRRMDGSVDFYRGWQEYKRGFGELCREFWLGNDILHSISSQKQYELRVDMEDFEGNWRYAAYKTFHVGDENSKYNLTVAGYLGNAGDSLQYHSGKPFSTFDADWDDSSSNCAIQFKGAWWYGRCMSTNPNALYLGGQTATYGDGVVWRTWKGFYYSMKTFSMKIRSKQ